MRIEYSTYEPAVIPDLIQLWNECLGQSFPMTERLMRQNLDGDPTFRHEGSWLARDGERVVGWVLAKALTDPPSMLAKYRGMGGIGALCVHPDYRRRGAGSELLRRAEAYLSEQGLAKSALYYPHHFLPGIPAQCDDAIAFFKRHGYTGFHQCVDLERDITEFEVPAHAKERWQRDAHNVVIRPLREDEQTGLVDFVAREFSPGWAYSTQRSLEGGGEACDFVVAVDDVAAVEDDDMRDSARIVGFCHTFTKDSLRLGGSTLWYPLLGENFGGLGPIGIAAAHRKRGLGLALLCESVKHNQRRGVVRMAIDWTVLADFYQSIGFQVWKRYLQASKALDS